MKYSNFLCPNRTMVLIVFPCKEHAIKSNESTAQQIHDVHIGVQPTLQADGVHLGVAAPGGVIVAEGVVVRSRFAVQVLTLETQVLRHVPLRMHAFALAASPGGGGAVPHDFTTAVGHFLRQAVDYMLMNLKILS